MARVTAWTVGLFGAGAALARAFTAPWVEPVLLIALGIAFLFVSRSGVRRPRAVRPRTVLTRAPVAVASTASPALAAERAPSAAHAPVVVEQSV
jgi:hypothetical protein